MPTTLNVETNIVNIVFKLFASNLLLDRINPKKLF